MMEFLIHQINLSNTPVLYKDWEELDQFEYMLWDNEKIVRKYKSIISLNIREDIKMKILILNILRDYGGIYVDSDMKMIEMIDNNVLSREFFINEDAGFEFIGCKKGSEVCDKLIEILKDDKKKIENEIKLENKIYICPKYSTMPVSKSYNYYGHGIVYTWKCKKVTTSAPENIERPKEDVSILIINNKKKYNLENLTLCLKSVIDQECILNIELVYINNNKDDSTYIKQLLSTFERQSRFITVKYYEVIKKMTDEEILKWGYNSCSNNIIIKTHIDRMMIPMRIHTQYNLLKNKNIACVVGKSLNCNIINGKVKVTSENKDCISTIALNKNKLPESYKTDNEIYNILNEECLKLDEGLVLIPSE